MPATSTINEQVSEAVVSGPGAGNRLFTCTGEVRPFMQVFAGSGQQVEKAETWTFLVGPALPQQFLRATASVSLAGYGIFVTDPNTWHNLTFESVEADWDDESGRTEVRVEVRIVGAGISFTLSKIGFSVTVLAELPGA